MKANKSLIAFTNLGDLHCFGLGDVLSTGGIVTGVDLKRSRLVVRPATPLWRAVMAVRLAPRRAWYWARWQAVRAWEFVACR